MLIVVFLSVSLSIDCGACGETFLFYAPFFTFKAFPLFFPVKLCGLAVRRGSPAPSGLSSGASGRAGNTKNTGNTKILPLGAARNGVWCA